MLTFEIAVDPHAELLCGPIRRTYEVDYPSNICSCELCLISWCNEGMPGRLATPCKIQDYNFRLYTLGNQHAVSAGCRDFTIAQFRKHVARNYPNTPKAKATLAILKKFEAALNKAVAAKRKPAKKAKAKK